MTNPHLNAYLDEARKHGMSTEEITQQLLSAGWQLHEFSDIIVEREPTVGGRPIISVRDIRKTYGKFVALNGVNLQVGEGSVVALLGPNGAGKTTLVRILSTLLKPDSGHAVIAGFDIATHPQDLRAIIGLSGQFAAVDEILTGRENLEMIGRLYHLPAAQAKARSSELLAQFGLEDAADRYVQTYSGGMKRRLDLALSIIVKPKILFLDEPTTGLDPRSRFELWHVIRDLVQDGTTVLLTTQYLEEADQLADRIFVIDHGQIIAQGTADELKHQVGGNVVELHLVDGQDMDRTVEIIRPLGQDIPHTDPDTSVITMPVAGGATILLDIIRRLDSANISIRDFSLRRPSLDDVFLKLTGHSTE